MVSKKTILSIGAGAIFIFSSLVAAKSIASADTPVKSTLTLEVSAPTSLPGLKAGEKPDPVYLQLTVSNGGAPVYSAPVFPGDSKTIALKIPATDHNGAQLQFVTSSASNIQPMSFIYAFTGERLACLINKNAKIAVIYDISTKLVEVKGIPSDC